MCELEIKENKVLINFLSFSVKNPKLGIYLDRIKNLFSRDLISLKELSELLAQLESKKLSEQKKLIKKITN